MVRWCANLSTATAHHGHLLVVLQHHRTLVVEIEHGHAVQLRGHAARLWHLAGIHVVDQGLHHRMVGGVEVVGQREGALSVAVVRIIAQWCHNPIIPADVREVHIQRVPPAGVVVVLAASRSPRLPLIPAALATATASLSPGHIPDGARLVPPIVRVGEQERLLVLPPLVRLVRAAAQAHMMMGRRLQGPHRPHLHQQSVVPLRTRQPPVHGRLDIEAHRVRAVQPDRLGVQQQIARLPLATHPHPRDVVDEHLVAGPVRRRRPGHHLRTEGVPRQLQLGGLQLLVGGNALHVEVQPKPMVVRKSIVDFTICKEAKENDGTGELGIGKK